MIHFVSFVFGVLFVQLSFASNVKVPMKEYIVNLDLPPKQRWSFVSDFASSTPAAENYFNKHIPAALLPTLQYVAGNLEDLVGGELADEMHGASIALGMNFGTLVFLNFLYELRSLSPMIAMPTAGHHPPQMCTSVVVQHQSETLHSRNLDWDLTPEMVAMGFQCNFQRNGTIVAKAGCFAGFVGMLTGISLQSKFALSLDERGRGGSAPIDLLYALSGGQPVTHVLRHVLLNGASYDNAVQMLTNAALAAPAYYIVSGPSTLDGVVLTRKVGLGNKLAPRTLSAKDWYVLETNFDWDEPAPTYDDRRAWGLSFMDTLGKASFQNSNASYVLHNEVMSRWPIMQNVTTQTFVMNAKTGMFHGWVVYQHQKSLNNPKNIEY